MVKHEKIECVIFDCDNVLVNTETIMISVLIDMASDYGVVLEIEEAVRLFSGRQFAETIKVLQAQGKKRFPKDFENQVREKAYSEFREGVNAVEGASDLLASLSLPYCVASSGPREKIQLNLELTDLLKYFDDERIFSCYDIGIWKPNPHIFKHAAKLMGFEPSQCVVVEDSLAGIEAAKAGGFRVFGLTNGLNRVELAEQGAVVFEQLKELPKLWGIE